MKRPDNRWGFSAGIALFALVMAALVYWSWRGFQEYAINHWFAALIGVAVGATEMMARYRDRPFAPMLSLPGIVYIVVNAGAAALAFYLVPKMGLKLDPVMHVLLAGLGAMAFFRSGLFTVRLGDADVAVGPNLILQIMLQALDRSHDRQRAVPRADHTNRIMAGVSFADSRSAIF